MCEPKFFNGIFWKPHQPQSKASLWTCPPWSMPAGRQASHRDDRSAFHQAAVAVVNQPITEVHPPTKCETCCIRWINDWYDMVWLWLETHLALIDLSHVWSCSLKAILFDHDNDVKSYRARICCNQPPRDRLTWEDFSLSYITWFDKMRMTSLGYWTQYVWPRTYDIQWFRVGIELFWFDIFDTSICIIHSIFILFQHSYGMLRSLQYTWEFHGFSQIFWILPSQYWNCL